MSWSQRAKQSAERRTERSAGGGEPFNRRLLRPDSCGGSEGPNDGEGETPTALGDAMPQKSDQGPSAQTASYGFRPGRRAHDAVLRYVQEGRRFVVDIDLEKFFDRVNHDMLMERLAKRIADRRVRRLIRRYLDAGVLANGVVIERHEGTPQGARCRRCWPMCCWKKWTRSLSGVDMCSCATPTTSTTMCGRSGRASG